MNEIDMVTFLLVKFVLNVGPWGIGLLVASWSAGCGYAGYVAHELRRKERSMQAQKFDHIKYDIQPDGSLGPGDNRNLEVPE